MDKGPHFLTVVLALVVFLGVVAYLFGPQIARPTFGAVRRQGEVINTALEKYRVDHGSFPENLEELIPDYLESISKPRLFGRQLRLQLLSRVRWQYRLSSDEDNYVLWISDSSEFGYSSVSGEWGFFASGKGHGDKLTTSSE